MAPPRSCGLLRASGRNRWLQRPDHSQTVGGEDRSVRCSFAGGIESEPYAVASNLGHRVHAPGQHRSGVRAWGVRQDVGHSCPGSSGPEVRKPSGPGRTLCHTGGTGGTRTSMSCLARLTTVAVSSAPSSVGSTTNRWVGRRFARFSPSPAMPLPLATDTGPDEPGVAARGSDWCRVAVVTIGPPPYCLPACSRVKTVQTADAVLVVAADGEAHPEMWPATPHPLLVVLSRGAPHLSVLASFAAGADACVRTDSTDEVEAHLVAMLRRHGIVAP
jgi:hypothetical protein